MSARDPLAPENRSERHIFLERRGYRQRRIVDAARMLPVIGLLLWLVPLVWPRAHQEGTLTTSSATLYVFLIWILLIVVGAFLAWKMTPSETADPSEQDLSDHANTTDQPEVGTDL